MDPSIFPEPQLRRGYLALNLFVPQSNCDSYANEDLTDLEFALSVMGPFASLALGLMLAGPHGVVDYWVRSAIPPDGYGNNSPQLNRAAPTFRHLGSL